MLKSKPPYDPKFRERVVELVRAGQPVSALAKKFGCTEQTIRNWKRQHDLDDGVRSDGMTTEERDEVARLRREVRVLREEREILKKAAAWFAQEAVPALKKRSDS